MTACIRNLVLACATMCGTVLAGSALAATPMAAGGGSHSLFLDKTGVVYAAGSDASGQLGQNRTLQTETPLTSKISGVSQIAAGGAHAVAVTSDGRVWTWGDNSEGQIGDGGTSDRPLPTRLSGITASRVAAGQYHSLALRTDGTLVAWGSNASGQLGDQTRDSRLAPTPVKNLASVGTIAAGWNHSLALKTDGTVFAWGSNDWGQLGNNVEAANDASGRNDSPLPVQVVAEDDRGQVAPLTDIIAIAAGRDHSLAIKRDGSVWLWGYIAYDADTKTNYYYPRAFKVSVTNAVAIAAGDSYSLVLRSDGTVWGWGDNYYGQLGNGTDVSTGWSAPAQAQGLSGIRAISAGRNHSEAVGADGTVWRWGFRYNDPTTGLDYYRSAPATVSGITGATSVAGGLGFALALSSNGRVSAWGANTDGQLGDGTLIVRSVPAAVSGLTDVIKVAAGKAHSVALRGDGGVWTWGANASGQLGDGKYSDRSKPLQVPKLSGGRAISAGASHTVTLKSDGTVWSWGTNYFGELGDGSDSDSDEPVQLVYKSGTTYKPLTGVTAIASGDNFNLALTSDGVVWFWGYDYYDEAANLHYYYPWATKMLGLPSATAIGAGSNHALVVGGDGSVWAFGDNYFGQLGDGTDTTRYSPVRVQGLTGVASVAGGAYHSLAVTRDGKVWRWGHSRYDNARDTNYYYPTPVQVSSLANVAGVGAGWWHSLAVLTDGTVWTWGFNYAGQLADGTFEAFRQDPAGAINTAANGIFDLDLTVANRVSCPLVVQTSKTGSADALTASFRLNLGPQSNCVTTAASRPTTGNGFAAAGYQVYVAAINSATGLMLFYQGVNNGTALPQPVWTQYTGGSLPMFAANLQGGIDDHVQVALFSGLDTRQLAGYDIYVGYGTSAEEMVANQRYKRILSLGADGTPTVRR